MTVTPASFRVPSQRPPAPSVTSVANDKDVNEMIPGAVHRSHGICCKLRKTSARKAVQPVIASNGVNFLQMKPVGSHSTSGREKGGKRKLHIEEFHSTV